MIGVCTHVEAVMAGLGPAIHEKINFAARVIIVNARPKAGMTRPPTYIPNFT